MNSPAGSVHPTGSIFGVIIALCGAIAYGADAVAQTAPPQIATDSGQKLQEIVVSAEKRNESLQNAPIAVSAIDFDQLAHSSITDIQGLASTVPNFSFGNYQGGAQLSIRGIGFDSVNPGGEGRVALSEDGVYLAQPSAGLNSFFDVDRIEVLRGPQGTLYGRNATGGAVNIITNDPTDQLSGYARQTFGNYSDLISEGAIGGPIAQGWSARVAFQTSSHGGYGKNLATGGEVDNLDSRAARLKVRYEQENFNLMLSSDYFHENDYGGGFHLFGTAVPSVPFAGYVFGEQVAPLSNPWNVAENTDPGENRTYWGAGAIATLKLNDAMSVKSITGYRRADYQIYETNIVSTGNLSPGYIFYGSRTFSEELQLAYNTARLHAIAGLYYFHAHEHSGSGAGFNGLLFGLTDFLYQGYVGAGDGTTSAPAAFANVTYKVTPEFGITLGERVGWERHWVGDYTGVDLTRPYNINNAPLPQLITTQNAGVSNSYQTPKVGLNYQVTRDVLAYAIYARGYKSGGFDIGSVAPPYKPETLVDYEGGLKSEWLNHHLRANLAGFYYDYSNIQVSFNNGTVNEIENASTATLSGVEAELSALVTRDFRLDFDGGYVHSEYTKYNTENPADPAAGIQNLTGNELIQAPKWTARLTPQYIFQLPAGWEATLAATWRYSARVYFTAFDQDFNSAPPNSQFDASLDLLDGSNHWDILLWGKNIGNKTIPAFSVTGASFFGFPVMGFLQPPATYGVTISYTL